MSAASVESSPCCFPSSTPFIASTAAAATAATALPTPEVSFNPITADKVAFATAMVDFLLLPGSGSGSGSGRVPMCSNVVRW